MYVYIYICVCVRACVYVHIRTYIYIYIYILIEISKHVFCWTNQTPGLFLKPRFSWKYDEIHARLHHKNQAKITLLRVMPTVTEFCHSFRHLIWKHILYIFWHSVLTFYLFWHSIWHLFWHILWHSFDILSGIVLTFFLAPFLAFYLAFYLTFYSGILSSIYSDILSDSTAGPQPPAPDLSDLCLFFQLIFVRHSGCRRHTLFICVLYVYDESFGKL